MEGHLDVQAPVNHEPVALDPALAYNVQLQACPSKHFELQNADLICSLCFPNI